MTVKRVLTERDRADVLDVVHRVAFILDAREYRRMDEVFDAEVRFENPGRLKAEGLDALMEAFGKIADPAISHHITNTVLSPGEDGTVVALSKALTIRSDKSLAAAEYTDTVRKTPTGWRIASRTIKPLPRP